MSKQDSDDITGTHLQLTSDAIVGHYRIIERIGAVGVCVAGLVSPTLFEWRQTVDQVPAQCAAQYAVNLARLE